MTKYKLNVARDVDTDEPGVYILNLPNGYTFEDEKGTHVRGYDTMRELRHDVKYNVIPCHGECCKSI